MQRGRVVLGMDADGGDAELLARVDDTQGDFTAIRDQNLFEHKKVRLKADTTEISCVSEREGEAGARALVLDDVQYADAASQAALASLLLPMMVAAGHDKARSAGLIASAGIIAPVIPPSIGFVIFGVAANVSISKLFLAGIVPAWNGARCEAATTSGI